VPARDRAVDTTALRPRGPRPVRGRNLRAPPVRVADGAVRPLRLGEVETEGEMKAERDEDRDTWTSERLHQDTLPAPPPDECEELWDDDSPTLRGCSDLLG
jgi:hypothetical protein